HYALIDHHMLDAAFYPLDRGLVFRLTAIHTVFDGIHLTDGGERETERDRSRAGCFDCNFKFRDLIPWTKQLSPSPGFKGTRRIVAACTTGQPQKGTMY
ncbi:hypothetical protein KIPB_011737, partial [Kipferlia bialata]